MSRKRILLIAGAAAIAVLIALLFQDDGSNTGQPPPVPQQPPADQSVDDQSPQTEQVWVMVASKNLPTGHNIGEGDLGWQAWPDDLDENIEYITLDADPDALSKYGGYVVQTLIATGEPVTLNNIVNPGASGFMAALLSPGMRAASVAIDQARAAGGFIVPNDRVDVILLQKARSAGGRGRDNTLPRVVIENVRVLSVDGKVNFTTFGKQQRRETSRGRRATLEVTPRDAQILAVASSLGTVHLVLRGVADISGYSGATADGLGLLPGGSAIPLYSGGRTSELYVGGQ